MEQDKLNYNSIANELISTKIVKNKTNHKLIIETLRQILNVLFEEYDKSERLKHLLFEINENLIEVFNTFVDKNSENAAQEASILLINELPKIKKILVNDLEKTYQGDPSATSYEEILATYPGILATTVHRIAHKFYELKFHIAARIISEYAHERTGIDIHPGATIGESFFIDHGTGVVIGETCIIGNNVSIYHGVTLGILNFDKDEKGNIIRGTKRHPTIEDNVIIYANAMVLGGNTVVGEGSIIGSNVVVAKSVPPNSKIINK